VRLAEIGGDPDHGLSLEPCEVGHDLAQMGVVGRLQLVLDQDDAVIHRVARENVGAERLDGDLGAGEFERDADHVRQVVDVLGEPRGELVCLMLPRVAQGQVDKAVEADVGHWSGRFLFGLSRPLAMPSTCS